MRRKINIVLALAFAVVLIAAAIDPYEVMPVYNFTGIMGDRAPANALSTVRELVNADIIVRTGSQIIKQRAGFTKLGGTLEDGPITGIFRFDPSSGGNELLAFSNNSIYRYNHSLSDFELLTGSNPTAGVCSVEAGGDTVRGSGVRWWELSKYRPQFIRIGDDQKDHLIKAILTDITLVLDTVWSGSSANGVACTIQISYDAGAEDVIKNPLAPKRGVMFTDTLIVVDGTERFRYGGLGGLPAGASYVVKMRSGGLQFRESKQRISFSGSPIDGFVVGDYLMFHNANVPGTSLRNQMLTCFAYYSGDYYMYADTATEVWLSADPTETYRVDWVSQDDIVPTLFFANRIQDVARDSIQDLWAPTAAWHLYTYTIWRTNDADAPHDWPSDTLDWGTYRATVANYPDYPINLVTNGDSTGIVIYDYGYATGPAPAGHHFKSGDTIEIYRMDSVDATVATDTVLHSGFGDGIQALLNNRLYYTGSDPSELWYCAEFEICGSGASDGAIYINRDDGDVITALIPYNRNMVVFKRRYVYLAIVSAYDNEIDEIILAESPTGAPSQEAVWKYGGLIYFVSPPHGLFAFDGSRAINISGPAQFYFADSIAAGTEAAIRMIAAIDVTIGTPALYISYTSRGGTENDRTLRFDLTTRQWSKYTNFGASAFAIMRGGSGYGDTLLIGTPVDGDSYVLKFPSGSKDTAEFITMQIKTGFDTFGGLLHNKAWLEYAPIYTMAAAGSLRTHWYLDWSASATFIDSFASSSGWQTSRRGLAAMQGRSMALMIETKKSTGVEVLGVEVFFEDYGRADD
jgi:hypothetical protein